MYGTATPAQAATLTDTSPAERPAGVGGGKAPTGYGAVYEANRRLAAHPDRIAAQQKCRTHWAVQAGEQIWRSLVQSATWAIEPVDDSPEAAAYAEHVDACLGVTRAGVTGQEWGRLVDETLTAALHGFGLWARWADDVGGRWVLRVESRHAGSIVRWICDAQGRMVGAEQAPLAGWGGASVLPAGQLVHAVYQPQAADDHSGVGLLRAVEPLYRDVVALSQDYAAGARRWAAPTPDVTIDPDKAAACGVTVTPEWVDSEIAKWAAVARDYVTHERAYIARPPWVVFGAYGSAITDLSALQDAIDRADRRILSTFYGQWLMLGTSGAGGSYSLGETQVQAARDHAQGLCDWIVRVWSESIRLAVEWQFGPVRPELLPRLRADGLASSAFSARLAQLPGLVSAGLMVPDAPMRAAVRQELELPEEDPSTATRTPAPGALVLPRAMQVAG